MLTGVGISAVCFQIAHSQGRQEKNEVFVETLMSTMLGDFSGALVGLYLISNPIGWDTAIVLAVGTTVISYGAVQLARGL